MSDIDFSKYYWSNGLIRLRLQREEDWEARLCNKYDSEARLLFNDDIELPVDIDNFKQEQMDFIRSCNSNTNKDTILLAIENNAGEHVGICNLFGINERHGRFGPVGIEINIKHRNKGYGTAAYRMIGHYMFNERRMHKWNNGYMEKNTASAMFHKKLGFIIEGIRPDFFFNNGNYSSEVLCGMTDTQFFENEKNLPPLR